MTCSGREKKKPFKAQLAIGIDRRLSAKFDIEHGDRSWVKVSVAQLLEDFGELRTRVGLLKPGVPRLRSTEYLPVKFA